jgi:peptide/nickel transport system permease protein
VLVYIIVFQYFFAYKLGWFPVQGWGDSFWQNLVVYASLPILIGLVVSIAPDLRLFRTFVLDEINQDYVRTARAKGVLERDVVLKHALRNALIPIITLGALEFGTLLSGAVLTEQVFTIPGFGKLIVDAVFNRDYAVVQGVVLVTATIYITLNLIADIAYVLVNPRLRA